MAIEVFNRREIKYFLTSAQYAELIDRIGDRLTEDTNCVGQLYTISNLYCDTADDYLIRTSLLKPTYKEKLRIRSYGVPGKDDIVYVEMKKKVDGLVNKRRTAMKLAEAYDFVKTGHIDNIKSYMSSQVVGEIEYLMRYIDVFPKLYVAYNRHAMFAKDGSDLRITFDTNIRTRRTNLRLEAGDYGRQLITGDYWLMEVKAERGLPLWFVRTLSEMKLYPTSFSKYGSEYQRYILETKTEGRISPCLTPTLQTYLAPQVQPEQKLRLAVL